MRVKNHLMDSLNYSKQDVTYNRKGEMSPRQQERFLRDGRLRALTVVAVGGLSAAFIAHAWEDTAQVSFYISQMLNALFFGWLAWSMNMSILKDAAAGRVSTVNGKPTFKLTKRGQILTIGNTPIEVTQQVAELLDPKGSYCAYYAPNSGKLLALEPKPSQRTPTTTKPTAEPKRGKPRRQSPRRTEPNAPLSPPLGVRRDQRRSRWDDEGYGYR